MPERRLLRILRHLSRPSEGAETTRLCLACAEVTEMSGAGIMLMAGDHPRGSVCTTNDVSAAIEELQYTLGEGPCVDAHRFQHPVVEPDLASPGQARWPGFAGPAVAAGARAVFGFPVSIDDVRIGALNLYRDRPGPLTDDQHADAVALAAVAARAIVQMQAGAGPGTLGADLEIGTNFRFVVHQAAGMVRVQLSVDVDEALLRLRAHAFADERPITDVARDVVERRLRFEPPDGDAVTRPPRSGDGGGDDDDGDGTTT